ncbi:hypothetical protein F66182_4915 [Fusarium sp. NRRL 66182]|nr:hypothetical protein F66182_4915 [Fusarium sp. NRRL 66182]
MSLVTPFASAISSPAQDYINRDFGNTNSMLATLSVTIYLLGYAIGPLFLAPLSEIYGRKPVLSAANFFFCFWQIGCALSPNMSALIVFRFLAGVGGSGSLTLGGGVISDVFTVDQRGTAMGVYVAGPLLGPALGPLVGGFVVVDLGWRWVFWLVLIVGSILSVLYQLLTPETNHHVLIQRKVVKLERSLGQGELKSCYLALQPSSDAKQRLIQGLTRPIKLLILSPLVFSLSLYIAFTYGVMYLLFTTIPQVFRNTYGFDIQIAGLVYIALGVGNMIGWAVVTLFSDKSVAYKIKAGGGVFVPEMRLYLTIGFSLLLPITFFWYGWSTYTEISYFSAIFSLIPFGVGIVGVSIPIMTYLVDAYTEYAASALAASTVFRSLGGMLLPLAGRKMYASLGLAWGNCLLGFICMGLIPVPWLIYKYGATLRAKTKMKL